MAFQLDRLGRISESPLTLNCPTTNLPPTVILWGKGGHRLENGTTFGMTTVLRDRQTSTFDNLLHINQTPQQAEGLYSFSVASLVDDPVQSPLQEPNETMGRCIIIISTVLYSCIW